jgi:glucose-1-phosphate cytidylyltransferase
MTSKMKTEPKDIPVVILCGGQGTRIAEMSDGMPKPMVEVGGRPILWHIMKHYSIYGFKEFILALGYKGEQIKRYFLEFHSLNRDFSIYLKDGKINTINDSDIEDWQVHLVDTGQETLTGGRIKRLADIIAKRTFMMTYGDGVSNVDLAQLLKFHRARRCMVTLTAVRSPARFGALEFDGDIIRHFKEKSTLHEGWINGGFFVIDPEALDYIQGDVMWEHAPLEKLAADNQMNAMKHEGFWQPMDTLRDLRYLESQWKTGNAPWKTW